MVEVIGFWLGVHGDFGQAKDPGVVLPTGYWDLTNSPEDHP